MGEERRFPWDEYAIAIRNLKNGIRPPFSGSYDNWFVDGMGAAIRSEIWACLAPGNPELAAKFAYQDACVDHSGNGMWAEVFLAAMESAAFVESDVRRIIEIASPASLPTASCGRGSRMRSAGSTRSRNSTICLKRSWRSTAATTSPM